MPIALPLLVFLVFVSVFALWLVQKSFSYANFFRVFLLSVIQWSIVEPPIFQSIFIWSFSVYSHSESLKGFAANLLHFYGRSCCWNRNWGTILYLQWIYSRVLPRDFRGVFIQMFCFSFEQCKETNYMVFCYAHLIILLKSPQSATDAKFFLQFLDFLICFFLERSQCSCLLLFALSTLYNGRICASWHLNSDLEILGNATSNK